ncbi:MAG TPA: site-2 protease family protein [Thermoanaerobaculia bacterium]|nr:site-2 protease family protein [Thermoanaerobaculia bacterium]
MTPFTQRIELFRAFGIPIRIDYSWFVVFLLVAWSLATRAFPALVPGISPPLAWTMGAAGALGLFASVLLHELGHAVTAQRLGVRMRGITLFLFGGVAEMADEPPTPRVEFLVAIAGPVVSVALALAGAAAAMVARLAGAPAAVVALLAYLGLLNGVLVAFNLIPAFPLDGGRVLRSALWAWKGSLRQATRIAAGVGSAFGLALLAWGLWRVVRGDVFGGIWSSLIGLFLRHAARMSYQQVLLRRALEGEPVERFMHPDPVTVPRQISVQELVDDYVYRHHHKFYPVVDEGGRLTGCVTTRRIKELPREEWERQTVGAIADRCDARNTVPAGADAMRALSRMSRTGTSRLLVVDGDRLLGVLSLKDLLKFFAVKMELEEGK